MYESTGPGQSNEPFDISLSNKMTGEPEEAQKFGWQKLSPVTRFSRSDFDELWF